MRGVAAFVSTFLGAVGMAGIIHESWLLVIACHMLSGSLAISMVSLDRSKSRNCFEETIAFGVPVIGGAVLCLYSLGFRRDGSEEVMEDYLSYIDPGQRLGRESHDNRVAVFSPKVDQLAPLADILRSNAPIREKRLAIEGLARVESPAAIETLREALSFDSVEIRFYAASILSQLEERLSTRLEILKQDIARGNRIDPEVEVELAQIYLDYTYYGLVDGVRRNNYLEQALNHADVAASRGARQRGNLLRGRILMGLKRYEEADAAFLDYLEQNPDSQTGQLWRAEVCYRQGRYADLRQSCREALRIGEVSDGIRQAVLMWT